MEAQLNQLLTIANSTIPQLVEAYNEDSREFNAISQELDDALTKIREYEITLKEQSALIVQQKERLDELSGKHTAVITLSNQRIDELEHKLRDAKEELKVLNKLNPTKLQKTNSEQKVKLAERLKALDAEKGKHRNTRRELETVQERLNNQKIGFWRNREERLIVNLTNKDLTLKDLSVAASMETMLWWQHESGLKLLFGYDKTTETVYCCDVIDPDTGEMQKPTATALKAMTKYFKENVK